MYGQVVESSARGYCAALFVEQSAMWFGLPQNSFSSSCLLLSVCISILNMSVIYHPSVEMIKKQMGFSSLAQWGSTPFLYTRLCVPPILQKGGVGVHYGMTTLSDIWYLYDAFMETVHRDYPRLCFVLQGPSAMNFGHCCPTQPGPSWSKLSWYRQKKLLAALHPTPSLNLC